MDGHSLLQNRRALSRERSTSGVDETFLLLYMDRPLKGLLQNILYASDNLLVEINKAKYLPILEIKNLLFGVKIECFMQVLCII